MNTSNLQLKHFLNTLRQRAISPGVLLIDADASRRCCDTISLMRPAVPRDRMTGQMTCTHQEHQSARYRNDTRILLHDNFCRVVST